MIATFQFSLFSGQKKLEKLLFTQILCQICQIEANIRHFLNFMMFEIRVPTFKRTHILMVFTGFLLLFQIGRRRCELFSILGLIASNTALAFLLSNLSTGGQVCYGIPVGQKGNFAALVFIFLQSIWFSFGVNTIPWIVTPELFRHLFLFPQKFKIVESFLQEMIEISVLRLPC